MTLTKWQRDMLFQVAVTRNPDSGSMAVDFAVAIAAAVSEGVPIDKVAKTAGLTTTEVRCLVGDSGPFDTERDKHEVGER